MRAFALGLLVVLAAGLAFLLWRTTRVVVFPDPAVGGRPLEQSSHVARHPEVLEAPSERTAESSAPTESHETVSSSSAAERSELREHALESIEARVHGSTRALFVRRPGASGDDELALRRPIPGARVVFMGGATVLAETQSGRDGRFDARFTVAGPCTVTVEPPPGWRVAGSVSELSRAVLSGETALEIAFLSVEVEIAGEVRGFLQSESGPWDAEKLPKRGAVLLDLVSVTDPFFSLRGELENGVDAHGAPTVEFVFRDVPRGEYELALSSLDAFRWHPKSLRVTPPAAGLAFLRYDREQSLPLVFRVFDARTREPITDFEARRLSLSTSRDSGVFLHTGPIALGSFPTQSAFQWSLWTDEHAPAFGDETSFVEQDGARVAEVYLERGWSTKVLALARDPTARPLPNAEVFVDGKRAGRTGADGMLVARAESKPKLLDVRVDGFTVVGKPLEGHAGKTAEQRGQVTLVFLEPR